jgi:phosphoglycolate phosphatase-like HAD superfamily hydrolase
MRVQGLIFDLDGTVADTLPLVLFAFRRAFETTLGRTLSDAEIYALFGPTEEGCVRRLVADGWEACLQAYLTVYAREHDRCAAPFPGLRPLLDRLQARGVRLALVTGKGAPSTAITLARLGLQDVFDAVETGSAEGPVKQQGLAAVLARWGCAPGEVAYIGDSASDMHDARALGMVALAAAWAPTADAAALAAAQPDALFTRIEELACWLEE